MKPFPVRTFSSCSACMGASSHDPAGRPALTVKLSTSCVACHKADDPHEGRFGNRCETCHTNSESFKGARVPSAALAVPGKGRERSR